MSLSLKEDPISGTLVITKPVCVKCFRAMREYAVGLPAEKVDRNSLGSETMHTKNFIIEILFKCEFHPDVVLKMPEEQVNQVNTYPLKKIKFHTLSFNASEKADIKKHIKKDAESGNPMAKKAINDINNASESKNRKVRI